MSNPFIGQVIMFGGNFAPRNWAFCHGQELAVSQYTALFSILGTTFGGDGRTTFGLPDFRGRIPIQAGNGPGLSNYNRLGIKGGVDQVTLDATQMPSHNHGATGLTAGPEGLKMHGSANAAASDDPTGVATSLAAQDMYAQSADEDMATGSVGGTITMSGNVADAGGGQAHSNLQPYQVVNFIIALQGIFPTET